MTNIEQLFCTPEQGKRLAELVPGLESAMVWITLFDREPVIRDRYDSNIVDVDCNLVMYAPALTLQELRDVLDEQPNTSSMELGGMMNKLTAPELAAWVIERLEEAK